MEAADAGDVDDGGAALEVGQHGTGHEEDAFEVGVDELVPVGVGGVFEGDAGWIYARAVEYVVYLAELRKGGVDKGLYVGCGADIDSLGE